MIRNQLKKWKEVIGSLENPKKRPNDLAALIISCLENGLTRKDAERIFGVSQNYVNRLQRKYPDKTLPDKLYFMHRARQLGASDEAIAGWFGFDRIDKVSSALAQIDE